jgi:hypothetical protein
MFPLWSNCYRTKSTRGYLEKFDMYMPKHLRRRLIGLICIMKFEQKLKILSRISSIYKHKGKSGIIYLFKS